MDMFVVVFIRTMHIYTRGVSVDPERAKGVRGALHQTSARSGKCRLLSNVSLEARPAFCFDPGTQTVQQLLCQSISFFFFFFFSYQIEFSSITFDIPGVLKTKNGKCNASHLVLERAFTCLSASFITTHRYS
ncbi:hypothetical protein AAFF_G00322850 [Aldrovandia affinis]|uniref:Uncharacterized protein n=1 Tax=Aldrovandia affinis TaxID=143900 RepID=A0AAD7SMA0_9TELE|nr:hypothetical protein AAFF_G00322850 [Aldrovandia affinis]